MMAYVTGLLRLFVAMPPAVRSQIDEFASGSAHP
jgi:hypothetical protein